MYNIRVCTYVHTYAAMAKLSFFTRTCGGIVPQSFHNACCAVSFAQQLSLFHPPPLPIILSLPRYFNPPSRRFGIPAIVTFAAPNSRTKLAKVSVNDCYIAQHTRIVRRNVRPIGSAKFDKRSLAHGRCLSARQTASRRIAPDSVVCPWAIERVFARLRSFAIR